MDDIYLRIISFFYDVDCHERIKESFASKIEILPIENLQFHCFEPYWKIEGYGELNITFSGHYLDLINRIKTILSSQWENEVTDSGWAKLFSEDVAFMWLSGVDREGHYISLSN